MARPWKHPKTGIFWLRRGVPTDLRDLVGKREELKSLDTRDPDEARRRHARAIVEVDERWANLRKGEESLTEREANDLAEPLFRKWLYLYADDPSNQLTWSADAFDDTVIIGTPDPFADDAVADGDGDPGVRVDALLRQGMRTFAIAQADYLLEARGRRVDGFSRFKVIRACALALQRASVILARSAETGEPVPEEYLDETPAGPRLPALAAPSLPNRPEGPVPQSIKGPAGPPHLTLTGVLAAWWAEAKAAGRKPSTYESYRNTLTTFVAFLGHDDATRVTSDDVVGFKDHRLQTPSKKTGKLPSAKTVKDSDLSALKTLFGWAVTNRKLAVNPATGITIKVGKPRKLRSKGFTDEEAIRILAAARDFQPGKEGVRTAAAKRWVPWLCAFTGGRVGELAQLRKEDVYERDGRWVLRITPEAGTVKTDEAREVVIHPQAVDLGFPAFVMAAPAGHLFLTPAASGDVLGPLQGLKNRLAEFSRALVPDEGVAPNHGWRHRFKTVGREVEIAPRILDAIQGQAPRTAMAT